VVLSAPFSHEIVPPDPSSVTDATVPVTTKLPDAPVVSIAMPKPFTPGVTPPLFTVTLLNVTPDAPMVMFLMFTPAPAEPAFVVEMVLLLPVTTRVPTSDPFDALNAVPLVVVIDMEVVGANVTDGPGVVLPVMLTPFDVCVVNDSVAPVNPIVPPLQPVTVTALPAVVLLVMLLVKAIE
jgi:hypothetical protein